MNKDLRNQDALFRMIKIFVIQYLSTIHGFKGFQTQAVNMMALYILKLIKSLIIPTKRILALQGRTIPNCLHLVQSIKNQKDIKLISLINYLDKQLKFSNDNLRISSNSLNSFGRQFFQNDAQTINVYQKETTHQNVLNIPYYYTYDYKSNPLHLKSPVDESFKKPPQYTFKDINRKVEKEQKSVQQLTNYSMRQMRRSLGLLNMEDNNDEQSQKKGQKRVKKSVQNPQQQQDRPKFAMINFI